MLFSSISISHKLHILMIAFSYHRSFNFRRAGSIVFCMMLLFIFVSQTGWAQQRTEQVRDVMDAPVKKTQLSEAAVNRMATVVTAKREEKRLAGPAFKASAERETTASAGRQFSFTAADVLYGGPYWDTQSGDNFSFPEDTHDFCRAYFTNDLADQDYYLNAAIDAGATLDVVLNWSGGADYDLYLFDIDGYPVGDTDPDANFSGANGIAYQGAGDASTETASILHDRGAASDEFVIVVDRFRGDAGTLDLIVSGDAGTFSVLEYIDADALTYFNTDTQQSQGLLTEGLVLSAENAANFSGEFNTDGCARSVVFTLVNEAGDPVLDVNGNPAVTDNAPPYATFVDAAGNLVGASLDPGTYTLTAIPYSQPDGAGVAGDTLTATFSVPTDDVPGVESFSLVDAISSQPIDGFNPIAEGSVIDLVELSNQGFNIDSLNIAANVTDPSNIVEQVDLNMTIALLSGVTQPVNVSDGAPPYSVYGDTNDNTVVNFFGTRLPLGDYSLSGDALASGMVFTSATVNFTVIGPRVSSFTLINALTEQPIDGSAGTPDYDPIPDGAVIDVTTLGTDSLSIRANTIDYATPVIESVRLIFVIANGGATIVNTVESFRPYAVFGDPTDRDLEDDEAQLDYNAWNQALNESFVLSGQPHGDNGGTGQLYGPMTINFSTINAAVFSDPGMEDQLALLPNYPNPFNPATAIRFNLPADARVKLQVYDMLGRIVATLVDGNLTSGYHEVNFDAKDLSSGMYLYRLETPTGIQVRPMTLLK